MAVMIAPTNRMRQAEMAPRKRHLTGAPEQPLRYNGAVPAKEPGPGNPDGPEVAPEAIGALGSFVAIGTA